MAGKSVNLGDRLNKPLYRAITGSTGNPPQNILAIGTKLRLLNGHTVWGTGYDGWRDLSGRTGVFLAVRGPMTREACLRWFDVPAVYGDPAIICRRFWTPRPRHVWSSWAWCPHFKDKRVVDGVPFLDIRTHDVQAFIDEMCEYDVIASSSLHALLLADLYGVPNIWVAHPEAGPSSRREPWRFKYLDYYASLGVSASPVDLADVRPETATVHPIPDTMIDTLLEVCPWTSPS